MAFRMEHKELGMSGLTDQASGARVSGGEAIERAHQAWQESMLKQLDALRQEIRASLPGHLAANCGATLVEQQIRLNYWGQVLGISWPELKARRLSDGLDCSV